MELICALSFSIKNACVLFVFAGVCLMVVGRRHHLFPSLAINYIKEKYDTIKAAALVFYFRGRYDGQLSICCTCNEWIFRFLLAKMTTAMTTRYAVIVIIIFLNTEYPLAVAPATAAAIASTNITTFFFSPRLWFYF